MSHPRQALGSTSIGQRTGPAHNAGGAGTRTRPLQGVSGVEVAAEDPVGGGEEGDREVEGLVEDPGPPGGREVQPGGTGLPLLYGRGKAGAGRERGTKRGVGVGAAGVGRGADGRGARRREGSPLFLPTPDSMGSAGTV